MINKILDASIFFSFDKSGYLRHKKQFKDELIFTPKSHAIITGGTSGIGYATAKELAQQGVHTFITGRSVQKGEKAAEASDLLEFISWDMTDWNKITEVVNLLPALNYVVLNAGGMPEEFRKNSAGVEMQFASQLFGHYYLIKELQRQNKLQPKARIVWVTSGGMYLSKLDLNKIFEDNNYDKVATYANVKRAQVTMLSEFKNEFSAQIVTAMHPGWVNTQALRESLPKFTDFMNHRLRTPIQGADTILWLLSQCSQPESGKLYFDRKTVKSHFFNFTKGSDQKSAELKKLLEEKRPVKIDKV